MFNILMKILLHWRCNVSFFPQYNTSRGCRSCNSSCMHDSNCTNYTKHIM